jgi:hypothetical protein
MRKGSGRRGIRKRNRGSECDQRHCMHTWKCHETPYYVQLNVYKKELVSGGGMTSG